MIDYTVLFQKLLEADLNGWVDSLKEQSAIWFSKQSHGDNERWLAALQQLPEIKNASLDITGNSVTIQGQCQQSQQLRQVLQQLIPWRKGPFQIANVFIDSEWRSDFKWDRVALHLSDLRDRRVLDVGCGNGYHCWRMLSQRPELVLGIDPSPLFNIQFQAIQHYIQDERVQLLPIPLEQMPEQMQWFDTVLSMGVLYHRRSPIDHLFQLKSMLQPGGELCLETLVIDGGQGEVLLPEDRYARMRNVWFLPSVVELERWMKRCGFINIRVADISTTEISEQRSTEWMPSESLAECLDPENPDNTVEGLPAPKRAVLIANRS